MSPAQSPSNESRSQTRSSDTGSGPSLRTPHPVASTSKSSSFLDGTAKANWVHIDDNMDHELSAFLMQWTQTRAHPRKLALFSVPSVSRVKENNPLEWSLFHSYVAIIHSPPPPQTGKTLWLYDSDMAEFSECDKASSFLIKPQVVLASGKVKGSQIRFARLQCSNYNAATRGISKCLYSATEFILNVVDDFEGMVNEGNFKRCRKLY
ncbi:hypothetical protein GGX14DRAFT_567519 [Mycena pura]|uniref:Uncharacterized protein n=1 Tax=Mycena pura TaxID=153505 RepID=A0AAD6YDQ0_9AGAR|nr:hypothetical protein GGX14DRAFT_567519 [Mycena pura]